MSHAPLIYDKDIRAFTEKVLEKYVTPEKLTDADNVRHLFLSLLAYKGLYNENEPPLTWVDIILAGNYLHNLLYDGTISSLFLLREEYSSLAETMLPKGVGNLIFSVVESRLGPACPIESLKTSESTPNGLYALCVWFYYTHLKERRYPHA